MTCKIRMTWKMKDDVIIIDGKDEFKYLSQVTLVKAIAAASLDHLNSSVFYY